eukprot:313122-Hanusia_phi.AAC.1
MMPVLLVRVPGPRPTLYAKSHLVNLSSLLRFDRRPKSLIALASVRRESFYETRNKLTHTNLLIKPITSKFSARGGAASPDPVALRTHGSYRRPAGPRSAS